MRINPLVEVPAFTGGVTELKLATPAGFGPATFPLAAGRSIHAELKGPQ